MSDVSVASPLAWRSGSVYDLTLTLREWVHQASVTGERDERRFGERLAVTVRRLPFLREGVDEVAELPCPGEWASPVVIVRVRGGRHAAGARPAVMMAGHYDTVGVSDYDRYGISGFDAEALGARFADADGLPEPVRLDARSGKYVFGRGSLDMKSGLVASLAALERVASMRERLAGDVFWIAAPDEENLSRGAATARAFLRDLGAREPMRFIGLINTDYVAGEDGPAPAYFGALGKALPSFLVTGLTAHVGDPFQGLDPITLAAEIVSRIGLSGDFSEHWLGGSTPPPVPLQLTDLKDVYNVQTAPAAAGYMNVFLHERGVNGLLEKLKEATRDALTAMARRYDDWGDAFPDVGVWTYAELCHAYPRIRQMESTTAGIKGDTAGGEPRLAARRRVLEECRLAGVPAPSVVWFLSPGYWAPVPDPDRLDGGILRAAVQRAAAGLDVALRDGGPYPYISDMSILAGHLPNAEREAVRSQVPGGEPVPAEFQSGIQGLPCVNLGPWGSGAHGPYERTHIGYSLGVLPELIARTVAGLLDLVEEADAHGRT